jgi:hypothetical protein
MDAYVINLPHRVDRWNTMVEDFKNSPFNLIRYDGIMIDDINISRKDRGYIGVARTHQKLVKEAKEQGLKTILILEDDCKPEPNYLEHWATIKEYLDNHLDEWDVFNGGICGVEQVKGIIQFETSKEPLYLIREKGGCFCHWLYINIEKAYTKLMDWDIHKMEIDLYYSHQFNHYTCFPLLAEQYSGYSDIGSREKDWSLNFLMAKMDLRNNIMRLCS